MAATERLHVKQLVPAQHGRVLVSVLPLAPLHGLRPRRAPSMQVRVTANPMKNPTLIFPLDRAWEWQKAEPKPSLNGYPNAPESAKQWTLNIIELIHWVSFPLGFYIAHFVFVNSTAIAAYVGGDMTRVFFLSLGLLSQVFGGGNAVLMHVYEGWQVAPFRNPLALPDPASKDDVDQLRVPAYNNAWLRACAYQMLFSFTGTGLSFFTMGALGITPWTIGLVAATAIISIVGPHNPRFNVSRNGEPVLPISVSLLVVFVANAVINLFAYVSLFGGALGAAWPAGLPWPAFIPKAWAAVLAPALTGAGGLIEGVIAESTFNQWWHFIAFVILLVGLSLNGALFYLLV